MKPLTIFKFKNAKNMIQSESNDIRQKGVQLLLSIPTVFNNIEYMVNRYANYYAMPEMEIADSEAREDYISELKVSYIEGLIIGLKNIDLDSVTDITSSNTLNTIMAYLSKWAKGNMLFGDHGVLNYLKILYPDATEHYTKLLGKVHKAGYKKRVSDTPLTDVVGVVGSIKTATKLQNIFRPYNFERYEELKDSLIYNNDTETETVFMKTLREAAETNFTAEELSIIENYLNTGERNHNTTLINRFKKLANQYLYLAKSKIA